MFWLGCDCEEPTALQKEKREENTLFGPAFNWQWLCSMAGALL